MGKSLEEIDQLSAYELEEWKIFDKLFPFGDFREDWRMGNIVATLVNANRGKGKPAARAFDFILKPPKTQKQKDEELKGMLRGAKKRKKD